MLDTKVLEINIKTKYIDEGISYGNVLQSILSNIYLNELDKFMEKLMNDLNFNQECKQNQKHQSIIDLSSFKNRTVSEKYKRKKETGKQKITKTNLKNLNYIKIKDVRYDADFVVGIFGDKKFAIETMNKIKQFIKSDLHLHLNISDKKGSLISIDHRQAFFLGFLFKKTPKHLNPVISKKLKGKEKTARTLTRLKHETVAAEEKELKNSYSEKFKKKSI
jgi:hypothetical protein